MAPAMRAHGNLVTAAANVRMMYFKVSPGREGVFDQAKVDARRN
jgi:hypothetical protein